LSTAQGAVHERLILAAGPCDWETFLIDDSIHLPRRSRGFLLMWHAREAYTVAELTALGGAPLAGDVASGGDVRYAPIKFAIHFCEF